VYRESYEGMYSIYIYILGRDFLTGIQSKRDCPPSPSAEGILAPESLKEDNGHCSRCSLFYIMNLMGITARL
jgi:hypothetical protein